jgi:hypothetical protein
MASLQLVRASRQRDRTARFTAARRSDGLVSNTRQRADFGFVYPE